MAKEKKQQEEESGEGAPLWIISFADMTSLLMAFFVLLTTFASFGPKEEAQLHIAINATLAPFGDMFKRGMFQGNPKDATNIGVSVPANATQGSEKPTFDKSEGYLKPTSASELTVQKVFTADSKDVFWASGVSVSQEGKEFLNSMAQLIERLHSRIVISESGASPDDLGLNRAIASSKYLIDAGIPEASISIAVSPLQKLQSDGSRQFQITILDEGICK
jgi:flagellar motor protein MotB